jgi:excisionase family DNA binding protein
MNMSGYGRGTKREHPPGSGTWRLRVHLTVDGRAHKPSKTVYGMTAAEASQALDDFKAEQQWRLEHPGTNGHRAQITKQQVSDCRARNEVFALGSRPEILTLQQAADYLQVSLPTLKRTIREDRKFPVFHVGGERSRSVRISGAALDAWIAGRLQRRVPSQRLARAEVEANST